MSKSQTKERRRVDGDIRKTGVARGWLFLGAFLATLSLSLAIGTTAATAQAPPPPGAKPAKPSAKPTGKPVAKPESKPESKPTDAKPAAPKADLRVAVRVEGEPITVAEVRRELSRVAPNGLPSGEAGQRLEATALQQLVDQRLILRNLARTKAAADPSEVEVMVQRLVKQLDARKITLADHLALQGIDEPALRRQIAWQMSWGRYLERYVTDENLEKYFQQNAREFDGTQVKVAHILWKVDAKAPADAWTKARDEAALVRQKIVGGDMTFADAAKKYSQAPTAAMGGQIGFIQRQEPMPESFSKAAFALEKDSVSAPVTSAFGVHLIQCLEIKPGMGKWNDSRREVEAALVRYLFQWLANKERDEAKVEYTGALPYFKKGTDELVAPNESSAPNGPSASKDN